MIRYSGINNAQHSCLSKYLGLFYPDKFFPDTGLFFAVPWRIHPGKLW